MQYPLIIPIGMYQGSTEEFLELTHLRGEVVIKVPYKTGLCRLPHDFCQRFLDDILIVLHLVIGEGIRDLEGDDVADPPDSRYLPRCPRGCVIAPFLEFITKVFRSWHISLLSANGVAVAAEEGVKDDAAEPDGDMAGDADGSEGG